MPSLGIGGCWGLRGAELGSWGPGTGGRAVAAEQRAPAGGRQPARRWKGKLHHVSGLKNLDGVPFILDFS